VTWASRSERYRPQSGSGPEHRVITPGIETSSAAYARRVGAYRLNVQAEIAQRLLSGTECANSLRLWLFSLKRHLQGSTSPFLGYSQRQLERVLRRKGSVSSTSTNNS
jgi:hypothetical protein